MRIARIFLLLMVLTSPFAVAGKVTQDDLKVTRVMTGYLSGEAFFLVDKPPANPNGCPGTTASYYVLAVDPSKSNVDQVVSVLLTAFVSGKNVEVQVYDDDCFSGHAVIRRVAIY